MILLFGRSRVPPWFYLFSTAMLALGTTFPAFWIMANNSWMQVTSVKVVEKRISEEVANGHAAMGGSLAGSASISGGVSSAIPSICM